MGKTKTVFVGETIEEPKKTKAKEKKKKPEKGKAPGLKGGERIKIVGGELPESEEKKVEEKAAESKKIERKPKTRGKKYKDAKAKVDKAKLYPPSDAVKLVKEMSTAGFDGTVEMHLVVKKIGLLAKVELPHATGSAKKIEVADEKTIEKLKKGKIDFDILLATPEMMPKIVPFAQILGPKGLMPNPKNETLIKSKAEAAKFSAETLVLKTEKNAPLVHTVVGKVSMKEKELVENIEAILEAIGKKQIVKAYVCSTMSPSVKVGVD